MKSSKIPQLERMPGTDEPTSVGDKSFLSKFACFNPINLFSACSPSAIYQRLPSRPEWSKPYVNDLTKDPVTQKSLEFVDKRRQIAIEDAVILKKKSDAHLTEYRRLGNKINQTNALNFRRQYLAKMKQVSSLENKWNRLNQMNDSIIMTKTNREVAMGIKQGTQELSQSIPDIDIIEDIMLDASEAMDQCNEVNAQFDQAFTSTNDGTIELDDEELLDEMNKEFDSNRLMNIPSSTATLITTTNEPSFDDNDDIILNTGYDLELTQRLSNITTTSITKKNQPDKIESKKN